MASQSSMLHVRIDDETKEQAAATLKTIGLSVSDAVRLFLRRVVIEQALPLDMKVPNAATRDAMAEAEAIIESRRARFAKPDALMADLEKAGSK